MYKIIGLFAYINRCIMSIGINCPEYRLLPLRDVANKLILIIALDNLNKE